MSITSAHHSFDIHLAETYGIEAAILIHHFIHWIEINQRSGKNQIDGRTWTYQTLDYITSHYPYLTKDQVNDTIFKLVHGYSRYSKTKEKDFEPVLVEGNYNKAAFDKTKWYAFKNEKMFTKRGTPKSTCGTSKSTCGTPGPIPDTKETDSEEHIQKDNVGTMPSSSKNFSKSLSKEQRSVHDKITKWIPEWGPAVKSEDVCAWFRSCGYTAAQVEEAFTVYRQDCAEAKLAGLAINNMGGRIRSILKTGRKPRNSDEEFNRQHASRAAQGRSWLEVTKRYVRITLLNTEIYFNQTKESFIRHFDEKLRTAETQYA